MAYDISKGKWPASAPLAPEDIRLHVELGQIGGSLANANNDSSWDFQAFVPYKDSTEMPVEVRDTKFLSLYIDVKIFFFTT